MQGEGEALVAALRSGDEKAFAALVDLHTPALIRAALAYVPSRAVAEEVVQETWIAVMRGIDGFAGRSSLKTWIFRILAYVPSRGARERRSVPFAALAAAENTGGPSVDPERFLPADHQRFPGHWALPPTRWPTPEEGLLSGRDARGDRGGDRGAAGRPTNGSHAARHRGLDLGGCL
jgi:RNA polymerase sigma-70 factor, ECF subfamily